MYIGRGIDQIDNISTLDNLSFNGSDATFNLTQNSVAFVPVSADALQIQIDGVIQSGNYTVSGSTVTFDFTPSGSSVCNGIKHFGVGLLTQPSDGSVNMAQLGASGTKDATTFLRGDNTFATAGTTINNNADNRVITGSGTANTLEGEANLTYDGSTLTIKPSSNVHQLKLEQNNATDYWSLHADSGGGPLTFQRYTGGAETEKFKITSSGDVQFYNRMMGETSIESDVFQARNLTNGNRNYRGLSDGGGQTFYVTEDGAGYFAGGTSSDATLKNVVENTPHGLDKIKDVQPKTYYWKKRGLDVDGNEIETDDNLDERKHYGVLAQDLQSILPEITYGTEGNMSVDYDGLLMVAINSIKELKTKIETLEAKVEALESA